MPRRSFLKYLCQPRRQHISNQTNNFLAHKSTTISKPEGTNLSTAGLNNVTHYLDNLQGIQKRLTESNRWLTDSIHFELNVQFFNPSSIKIYEILSLHNRTVMRELIQHYQTSHAETHPARDLFLGYLNHLLLKKKKHPTKTSLSHQIQAIFISLRTQLLVFEQLLHVCEVFFIMIMLHMQKNVWPSTSDAMPHSHGLQGEAISPSLCFLALADRDSLFNFIDQTKDKTTIIAYI